MSITAQPIECHHNFIHYHGTWTTHICGCSEFDCYPTMAQCYSAIFNSFSGYKCYLCIQLIDRARFFSQNLNR